MIYAVSMLASMPLFSVEILFLIELTPDAQKVTRERKPESTRRRGETLTKTQQKQVSPLREADVNRKGFAHSLACSGETGQPKFGGASRARTDDLLVANEALSQTEL